MFLFRFEIPRLIISDYTSSEDERDTPSTLRIEEVFSDDYFYDTYKESIENSDNGEI